jgi:hypothetical protein
MAMIRFNYKNKVKIMFALILEVLRSFLEYKSNFLPFQTPGSTKCMQNPLEYVHASEKKR